MVSSGGGLLSKGRVIPPFELGINVTGHVPHVGDSWSGVSELGSGIESDLGFLAIPEVNPIVVCRMHRVDGKNLLEDGIDRLMAVNREATASELPEANTQESPCLKV